jgi:hypothetical protein
MKTLHPMFLGIKLSDEENRALQNIAKNKGFQKSSYARSVLREHLIHLGAIMIYNPAPQGSEITALTHHD